MLHSYWSQHPGAHNQYPEKPPHWEAQALWWQRQAQPKINQKENSQEKATQFRWYFKWHEAHIPWKKKPRKYLARGGEFTFKPPAWCSHSGIMAERPIPHRFSHYQQQFGLHPWTYSKEEKPCQPRVLYPEKSFRNEGSIKTFPDKANLMEFITTSLAS